jgi:hypothetical protein
MAPITSTAVGVSPQVLDDPALKTLLSALNQLDLDTLLDLTQPLPKTKPAVFDELSTLLEPWPEWVFEEQVSHCHCQSLSYTLYHVVYHIASINGME